MRKPIYRNRVRLWFGTKYYGFLRMLFWLKNKGVFTQEYLEPNLEHSCFSHSTILLRKLKDVDLWMQKNKVVNHKIAVKRLNKIQLKPGEVLNYWKIIGKPTRKKGILTV